MALVVGECQAVCSRISGDTRETQYTAHQVQPGLYNPLAMNLPVTGRGEKVCGPHLLLSSRVPSKSSATNLTQEVERARRPGSSMLEITTGEEDKEADDDDEAQGDKVALGCEEAPLAAHEASKALAGPVHANVAVDITLSAIARGMRGGAPLPLPLPADPPLPAADPRPAPVLPPPLLLAPACPLPPPLLLLLP